MARRAHRIPPPTPPSDSLTAQTAFKIFSPQLLTKYHEMTHLPGRDVNPPMPCCCFVKGEEEEQEKEKKEKRREKKKAGTMFHCFGGSSLAAG